MRYLRRKKQQKSITIVFKTWNAYTKIQSTSLEPKTPNAKVWLIYLRVNFQQIKFENGFRA